MTRRVRRRSSAALRWGQLLGTLGALALLALAVDGLGWLVCAAVGWAAR